MKRLVRSKSGRQIYGQKWQNVDGSNEPKSDDDLHSASTGKEVAIPTTGTSAEPPRIGGGDEDNKNQIRQGSRQDMESMHRAALEGDWLAAEIILARDPNLAIDYITEGGDRALHVAAAMKHKKLVQKLVERISQKDLELRDERGYTACCYAAISGDVQVARLMIDKNSHLVTLHDANNMTPLHKAASRGRTNMVSYFLKSIKVEDLSNQEWFDILLFTIRREMFDLAIKIVKKNVYLATMTNQEGTALHFLARHDFSNTNPWLSVIYTLDMRFKEKRRSDFQVLAEKLWTEMQRLEKASVVELIQKHYCGKACVHDATQAGHVKIVTMLIGSYPQLIWDTDSRGYTIFHIAVLHRRSKVYDLIHHVGAKIDMSAISQDLNGDNILHLAAKLAPPTRMKIHQPALQMHKEMLWFKNVEKSVPPSCQETRNNKGQTPQDLFSEEHKRLMEKTETWMRNTADSCMLVSTILLTVVFAAAFALPGGNSDSSGLPVLEDRIWFKVFIASEVAALFSSLLSMLMFWSVMTSNFAEERFLAILPLQLMLGLEALVWSVMCTISAFMAAIFLIFDKKSKIVWFGYGVFFSVYYILFWAADTIRLINLGKKMTMGHIVVSFLTLIRNRWNWRKRNIFSHYHATANT